MARCEVCLKTGMSGHNVSHSKRRTNTRWFANVHKATLVIKGTPTKLNICTRCMRTHYKNAAKA